MIRNIVFAGGALATQVPGSVANLGSGGARCTALSVSMTSPALVVAGAYGYRYAFNTPDARGALGSLTVTSIFPANGASANGQAAVADYHYGAAAAVGRDATLGFLGFLGAPRYDNGATEGALEVYSYASGWTYRTRTIGSPTGGTRFGCAVACSGDASTVVVGAYNTPGPGSPAAAAAGAVRVYTRTAASYTLTERVTLQPFGNTAGEVGSAVAMQSDGSSFVVGAPARLGGTARVAFYTGSGASWALQPAVTTTAPQAGFGYAVAMSHDGQWLAVSSVPVAVTSADIFATPVAGAVTLYSRSGSTWVQQQVLTPPTAGDQHFGFSVALDQTGSVCVVGAPTASDVGFARCGAAYVYVRSGASWSFQARITAAHDDTYASGGSASAADYRRADDNFGSAVTLTADGKLVYVASYRGRDPQTSPSSFGYVYAYRRY